MEPMSKLVRFVFRGMSVLVGVAAYAALLVFASAKNIESDDVQQRLVHFRGCDQIAVARRTHQGPGPCFRWERSRLATGASESCATEVIGEKLPRCASLRTHLADMGITTPRQLMDAQAWFYHWEDDYEEQHHARHEWQERRQEAEGSGPADERVAWSILNGFFAALERLGGSHDRYTSTPEDTTPGRTALDAITVERLHVYWLAHQLPAECLTP